jgi:hypothetical protein
MEERVERTKTSSDGDGGGVVGEQWSALAESLTDGGRDKAKKEDRRDEEEDDDDDD